MGQRFQRQTHQAHLENAISEVGFGVDLDVVHHAVIERIPKVP